MNYIILAGGYGTRFKEDLEKEGKEKLKDLPKALLPIGNSCILNRIFEWLPKYANTTVVTNDLFFNKFKDHLSDKNNVKIINDETKSPEEKLWSVGDLILALRSLPRDDFLLLSSDTIFNIKFTDLEKEILEKKSNIHLAYREDSKEIHKKGVMEIDTKGKIISLEEKPEKPQTKMAGIPVYFIKKETIPYIEEYYKKYPNKLDRLGDMISYLIKKTEWYALIDNGKVYDIGSLEMYNKLIKDISIK